MEIIVVFLVIGLIAVSGFYVARHPHPSAAVTTPTLTIAATQTPAPKATEAVYKSSHSTIQFSYPASWKLTANALDTYILENVTLQGPNNFQMNFELETNHVNTGRSCVQAFFGAPVPVNASYIMIPTLDSANKNSISSINLMAASYSSSGSGCGLNFYPNPAGKTMGFTFAAGYAESKPATGYFDLPETQAAKLVFASLKQ